MHTVLIIEDDPCYRDVMEVVLKMEGFEVHTAPDGPVGIVLAATLSPDVILCDILMPGMDGYSVLEALKQEKTQKKVSFIFVTALAERCDVRRGMAAGADDYLTKPFTSDELVAAVDGRIKRYEAIAGGHEDPALSEKHTLLRKRVTCRELEVLLLVGQGASSKRIADLLKVSIKTVEVHRSNLMKKLNVPNAASLARWAMVAEKM